MAIKAKKIQPAKTAAIEEAKKKEEEGQKEKEARFRKNERDKIARRKWAVTTKLSGKSVESIKRKLSQLSELMRSGDVDDCDVKKVYKAVSDVVNSSKMQQSLVSALKRAAEE